MAELREVGVHVYRPDARVRWQSCANVLTRARGDHVSQGRRTWRWGDPAPFGPERRLVKAWARLAAMAELDAAAPQTVPGALLPATRPELADQYLARAATRPDIRALERAEAATELDHKAATRARVPELTLGAGWKGVQYIGLRSDGFVVNASVTLPVVDRGQGPRRRALAEGQALRGRVALARQELAGEILGLRAEADRLHILAEQFTRERRRDAEDLMRIADAAYRGGELGILELLDAFRGAVDDELQGLELALMARRARIELERAAGGGLP